MGKALYLVLKEKDAEAANLIARMSGKALAKYAESLDELASDLGVMPLMRFFSTDPDELRGMMGTGDDDDDFEGDDDADRAEESLALHADPDADEVSTQDLEEEDEEEDEDDDGAGAFVEQWFDAAEGLETARGLIDAIEEDPDSIDDADAVLADLRDMERILVIAAEGDIPFHVTMDF